MKKVILKNKVAFNFMFDINMKVKTDKLKKIDITENDKEFFKNNLLKTERIEEIKNNTITISTDLNRYHIQKYEGFYTITESINYHAIAYRQETNYYKLSY